MKDSVMQWWRYSGAFLICTAVFHLLFGTFVGIPALRGIVSEGIFNTIGTDLERNAVVWFLVSGVLLLLLGQFARYYTRQHDRPVPRFVGWYLLVTSIAGIVLIPLSGFWLLFPQGLLILLATGPEPQA